MHQSHAIHCYAGWPISSLLYTRSAISCLCCMCQNPVTFVIPSLKLLKALCCSPFDFAALSLVIGKPTWVFKHLLAAWALRWRHW